ncbi:uncharacterized protein LOC133887679 [Phragmites australis]|uniref:uncharacterized protein LOC133887679 n=1 Tax=Phragmites australis TaxID=29695 RepID=UPI002D7A14EE|nr:uncharacterized protein LOC133887679 [Phragmites australis]
MPPCLGYACVEPQPTRGGAPPPREKRRSWGVYRSGPHAPTTSIATVNDRRLMRPVQPLPRRRQGGRTTRICCDWEPPWFEPVALEARMVVAVDSAILDPANMLPDAPSAWEGAGWSRVLQPTELHNAHHRAPTPPHAGRGAPSEVPTAATLFVDLPQGKWSQPRRCRSTPSATSRACGMLRISPTASSRRRCPPSGLCL